MIIAATPITPDDLLRMPDGQKYELVDGQLRELNGSVKSCYIAGEIFSAISQFCENNNPGWVLPGGASFRCFPWDETRVRRADVSYIQFSRLSAAQFEALGHCSVVPDLVVEVVSPNDLVYDVDAKIEEWLAAGVRLVWVVHPGSKHVGIYTPDSPGTILRGDETLHGEPVLPGFSVRIADLFRLPGSSA